MMNHYLAKTNPIETIQEHTDHLLVNYYILRKLYPNLKVNWKLLEIACLYHDLGKMNIKFQTKLEEGKRDSTEIAHNLLSLAFLNTKKLGVEYGFTENDIKLLAHAIAYHHNRGDYNGTIFKQEIEELKKEVENFKYDKVIIDKVKTISPQYFKGGRIHTYDESFEQYIMLKGLLNRLDYAASGHIDVEVENNFLEASLDKLLHSKDSHIQEWNKLQNFMIDSREENVITIAQTGMGKTEAGLLWIGDNKGFFTLPLKTAINEIYNRITNGIVEKREYVGLLHSDTYAKYLEKEAELENKQKDSDNRIDVQEYYNRTKQLSLPLTICTLDQLFDFVYLYTDFEPKLATLAYSKIVIDEIQMYSPDLLAYLINGLKWITRMGGKFAILTATFPPFIEQELEKLNIAFKYNKEEPYIEKSMIRHSIEVIQTQLTVDKIIENFASNKILIVCNTVKKAQEIYEELSKHEKVREYLNLLHSKFIKKDREEKEKAIMQLGKADNKKEFGIWIGTQVVEASLDIDFDMLFTELSDINGLLQRLGRCYRKRKYEGDSYNCYVFVGDNKPCSGIHASDNSVIDIQIFNNSKNALIDSKINGSLSEEEKLALIEEVYSFERIKETNYYIKFKKTMNYLNLNDANEISKSEVKKIFRNISTVTIIPKPVYDENREIIDSLYVKIKQEFTEGENYQVWRKCKYRAIDKFKKFTVSVGYNEVRSVLSKSKYIELGKFEIIYIIDCGYTFEKGIIVRNNKEVQENPYKAEEFDAMFI